MDLSREELLGIITALVARSSTGVCRLTDDDLQRASASSLIVEHDRDGDLWVRLGNSVVMNSLEMD